MSVGSDETIKIRPGGPRRRPPRRSRLWQRVVLVVIGAWIAVSGRRQAKPGEARPHLWSDNTRRMGVRFTDRLRDVWRNNWIRPHPNSDE